MFLSGKVKICTISRSSIEAFTVNMARDAHRLLPYGIHTCPNNWNKKGKGTLVPLILSPSFILSH